MQIFSIIYLILFSVGIKLYDTIKEFNNRFSSYCDFFTIIYLIKSISCKKKPTFLFINHFIRYMS